MAAGDDDEAAAAAEAKRIGERMVWAYWAVFTFFPIMFCATKLNYKLQTQRLGHPPDEDAPLTSTPVMVAIFLIQYIYALILCYLTFYLQTKPFQLSPRARLWIDVAFALFGFGLAAFFCWRRDDDVWLVLLVFGVCQQFFPIFNLLGCFRNFSALDAAQAAFIQAAALASCLFASDFVLALTAVLSLALILVTNMSSEEELLPETTSVV